MAGAGCVTATPPADAACRWPTSGSTHITRGRIIRNRELRIRAIWLVGPARAAARHPRDLAGAHGTAHRPGPERLRDQRAGQPGRRPEPDRVRAGRSRGQPPQHPDQRAGSPGTPRPHQARPGAERPAGGAHRAHLLRATGRRHNPPGRHRPGTARARQPARQRDRRPAPAAVSLVSDGIQRTARYAGAPQKYHATVSRAWVQLVGYHAAEHADDDFAVFAEHNPALLDKRLLTRFYHPATLATPRARTGWAEPDRAPFPWCHADRRQPTKEERPGSATIAGRNPPATS